MLKQKIKACSKFSFAKRIRGLASKLAELEPFSFEWWKMVKNSRFWHNRQISANLCIFPKFSFRRHGHIFQRKFVLYFSLTHKLLIFYVYEVSLILVHPGLRKKQTPQVEINHFRGQYKILMSIPFPFVENFANLLH